MKKAKYEIEYVYLGERVDAHFRQISQWFRSAKGDISRFVGVRGIYVGESYLLTKKGSIKAKFPPQPKTQSVFLEAQERLDYEAHKEIAKHQRLCRKKALTLKKPHRDIVAALELLRPFTRRMDTLTLRRFAEYLENQLSKRQK